MKFTKMHGIGNDYLFVNCFEELVTDPERMAIVMSRDHFGAGSDGLVLIEPADGADFGMRIFNADGSEAEMCGNAIRCIGKYVYERGMTDKTELTVSTKGGLKQLWLTVENGKVARVKADMRIGAAPPPADHGANLVHHLRQHGQSPRRALRAGPGGD